MTKIHEEHRYGTLQELARWARENSLRGELTLVLAGADPDAVGPVVTEPDALIGRFQELTAEGLSRRQAVKQLSQELRLPSRRVYQEILKLQASKSGGALEDS
jgi:16S rRNA (cytidine1402-2'-O)-methyltransferase